MLPDRQDPEPLDAGAPSQAAAHPPLCKSADLLKGDRLYIEHHGEIYCLRLTKAGRLLLTK